MRIALVLVTCMIHPLKKIDALERNRKIVTIVSLHQLDMLYSKQLALISRSEQLNYRMINMKERSHMFVLFSPRVNQVLPVDRRRFSSEFLDPTEAWTADFEDFHWQRVQNIRRRRRGEQLSSRFNQILSRRVSRWPTENNRHGAALTDDSGILQYDLTLSVFIEFASSKISED